MEGDFHVGAWLVQPKLNSISGNGRTAHVEPKAMQVLVYLAEHAGDVMPKERIIQAVWADTFVTDDVLTRCISELRKAFEDDPHEPSFIQTIPKGGYRLIAPVEFVAVVSDRRTAMGTSPLQNVGAGLAPPSGASVSRRTAPLHKRWAVLATGGVLVIVAALVALNVGGLRDRLFPRPVAPAGKIRLVVLPFDNMSGDPEQEYFSDGMTEEMTAQLARLYPERLLVIGRASAMTYKGRKRTIDEIGKELRVQYVLEGSVRRQGDRVRVTAQLIEVGHQMHIWAQSYDRDVGSILWLQADVARAIGREIKITLSPDEQTRISQARPVNPEAYELHLKGRYHFYQRNLGPQELRTARDYFEQALRKDPSYAPAYSGLADAYVVLAFRGAIPRAEGYERAQAAATKALELDETLAEAHASLAGVKSDYDLDWAGSERELKRAIELNPNYAQAHDWYAQSLTHQGRHVEAIAEARRAVQLDPLTRPFNNHLGGALLFARRNDEAIEHCRKMTELDPKNAGAYHLLGSAYRYKGAYKQAIEAYKKQISLEEPDAAKWADEEGFLLTEPDAKKFLAGLKQAYSQGDMDAVYRYWKGEIERHPKSFPPELMAWVYVHVGEKDRAFPWLEKMVAERQPGAFYLKVHPDWDPLRSDPRFQDLLRRMNFPP